jgi:hypothetical protein
MDEDIAPDVRQGEKKPLKPEEAVQREEDKYGESDMDQNRQDQRDMHHAEPDEHF